MNRATNLDSSRPHTPYGTWYLLSRSLARYLRHLLRISNAFGFIRPFIHNRNKPSIASIPYLELAYARDCSTRITLPQRRNVNSHTAIDLTSVTIWNATGYEPISPFLHSPSSRASQSNARSINYSANHKLIDLYYRPSTGLVF